MTSRRLRLPRRLLPKEPPEGTAIHFLLSDDRGDHAPAPRTVAQMLLGLPSRRTWALLGRMYSLEIWSTRDAHRLVAYAPKGISGSVLENYLSDLNPGLRVDQGPPFPEIAPDSRIRAARLQPLRNPHHMFATDLGKEGPGKGPRTPLSILFNATPTPLPPGVTLVTELSWRRHHYPGHLWRANPSLHVEFSPFRRHDTESVDAKKRVEETFSLYVRLLEIQQPGAQERSHALDHMLAPFNAWNRPNGNRLVPTPMFWWWPADIIDHLYSMYHRIEGANTITGNIRPHLSVDELAAFIDPSTAGIRNRALLHANTRPLPASTYQRTRRPDPTAVPPPTPPGAHLDGTRLTAADVEQRLRQNTPSQDSGEGQG